MKTHDSPGIVFDSKSGISEEEQREILAKINNITEKNRLSLSENPRFKAKKSGVRFPVIVIITAFAALAGGLILLSSMQGKTEAQVRTGAKVYNNVERALIEEIRKETLSLLEAKDKEISLIIFKLEEIDAELFGLGSREFTTEERSAKDRLRVLQKEYRSTLSVLQNERSQILEDARAREALLRAQLESRSREPALVSEQNAADGELDRLNMEQANAAAIEAQIGAFFANLNRQIADNNLDEAAGTIKSMRDFINAPAFQALRSIQARKGLYTQAINSFETMVEETRKYQTALNSGADIPERNTAAAAPDLQAKIAQLEQNLAEKDKTIEALSSQGSGTTQRLNELNSNLQAENKRLTADAANLQQNVNQTTSQYQRAVNDLEAEKARTATLTQTVTAREAVIQQRDNSIRDLQRQNETQTQRINRIQELVRGKAAVNMTIGELSESVNKIQEVLGLNQ